MATYNNNGTIILDGSTPAQINTETGTTLPTQFTQVGTSPNGGSTEGSRVYFDTDNTLILNGGTEIRGADATFVSGINNADSINGNINLDNSTLQLSFGGSGQQWTQASGAVRCTNGVFRITQNTANADMVIQVKDGMSFLGTNSILTFQNQSTNAAGLPNSTPGIHFDASGEYGDITLVNPTTGNTETVRTNIDGAAIGVWINLPKFLNSIGVDYTAVAKRTTGVVNSSYVLRINGNTDASSNGMWIIGNDFTGCGIGGSNDSVTGSGNNLNTGIYFNPENHFNQPVMIADNRLNTVDNSLAITRRNTSTNIIARLAQSVRPQLEIGGVFVADQKIRVIGQLSGTDRRLLACSTAYSDNANFNFSNFQSLTNSFAVNPQGYWHINSNDTINQSTPTTTAVTKDTYDDLSQANSLYWLSYTHKPADNNYFGNFDVETNVDNRIDLDATSANFGLPTATQDKAAVVDAHVQDINLADITTTYSATDLNQAYAQSKGLLFNNHLKQDNYCTADGSTLTYNTGINTLTIENGLASTNVHTAGTDLVTAPTTIGIRTGATLSAGTGESAIDTVNFSGQVNTTNVNCSGLDLTATGFSLTNSVFDNSELTAAGGLSQNFGYESIGTDAATTAGFGRISFGNGNLILNTTAAGNNDLTGYLENLEAGDSITANGAERIVQTKTRVGNVWTINPTVLWASGDRTVNGQNFNVRFHESRIDFNGSNTGDNLVLNTFGIENWSAADGAHVDNLTINGDATIRLTNVAASTTYTATQLFGDDTINGTGDIYLTSTVATTVQTNDPRIIGSVSVTVQALPITYTKEVTIPTPENGWYSITRLTNGVETSVLTQPTSFTKDATIVDANLTMSNMGSGSFTTNDAIKLYVKYNSSFITNNVVYYRETAEVIPFTEDNDPEMFNVAGSQVANVLIVDQDDIDSDITLAQVASDENGDTSVPANNTETLITITRTGSMSAFPLNVQYPHTLQLSAMVANGEFYFRSWFNNRATTEAPIITYQQGFQTQTDDTRITFSSGNTNTDGFRIQHTLFNMLDPTEAGTFALARSGAPEITVQPSTLALVNPATLAIAVDQSDTNRRIRWVTEGGNRTSHFKPNPNGTLEDFE